MDTFWSEKSVLITGATGLVGYWLTNQLIDFNARVVALIRDNDPQSELIRSGLIDQISVVNGSLESLSTLERTISEYEVDTVFHLGAQTLVQTAFRSPLATFEANIRGTYHLLEACRTHSSLVKRIVIASSDKAYGTSDVLPYRETMSLEGQYPYDVSKSCADLIAQSYFHTYRLPITIARCGNIYGGGDLNWSRLIPSTIRSLLRGETPLIRSDGTFIRDYIFVKDVVSAYLALAQQTEKCVGEAFNFAPSRPHTVLQIVKLLAKLMGYEYLQPKILNTTQAEIHDQYLCSEKAETVLKWTPSYSLEEGLKETIYWYESRCNLSLQH